MTLLHVTATIVKAVKQELKFQIGSTTSFGRGDRRAECEAESQGKVAFERIDAVNESESLTVW